MTLRNTINLCASLVFALTSVGLTKADQESEERPQGANGEYRVVINQTCVRTPFQVPPAAGFDPATKQLLVDGETVTALGTGLLRLGNDGSAELTDGRQTEISMDLLAAGKTPVTPPAEFTCAGRYAIEEGKMTLTLTCDVKVPDPGVRVTVGPQEFEGHIDRDKKTINLTNIAGGIQAVTVSVFGNPVQLRQRVCTQHALASR
jgi:hypothetical protein